jgi:non-specific serine/threonine protein kinase
MQPQGPGGGQGVTFGTLLRGHRRKAGLTQEALAERAGLGVRTIQALEAGDNRPHGGTVWHLARALGLADDILTNFVGATAPTQRRRTVSFTDWETGRGRRSLPEQPNPLIGREREAVRVHDLLLRSDTRLLTLTGPPGVGKTRLAIEVAARSLSAFSDGVFFIDLSPVADAALVVSAIARGIGVQDGSGPPLLARVQQHVRGRRLLLVLDNFEQVRVAARDLADLLAACQELKILVTSRVPLQLRWERQVPVPPLALPDLRRLPDLVPLTQTAAVELFIERARAVRPTFALTGASAPTVAETCVRLDGLPLAIELAAAHADVLRPDAMLDGLRRSGLDLLEGSAQDLPGRHQTLRAAIGWSDRLLDSAERTLFRRLAVFAGGCTPAAAEAICNVPCYRPLDVGQSIASLVRKNLVRLDDGGNGGEARLRLLELVREYAGEQLQRSGEEPVVRARHRDWFLALAEQADTRLRGPEQRTWLQQLEAEHDNLRAGLTWSLREPGGAAAGLRIAGALAWFWRLHGHIGEGRRWLEAALAVGGEAPAAARTRALNGAGLLAYAQGDYECAQALLTQSLLLARDVKDASLIAWALHGLGRVAYGQGDHGGAVAAFEESLASFTDSGDTGGSAYSIFFLGCLARDRGEYGQAAALYAETLERARDAGDTWIVAFALYVTGNLAWLRGDRRQAEAFHRDALVLARDIGATWAIAECLWGLAGLAGTFGEPDRAARLHGAERALREAVGAVLLGGTAAHEPAMAAARATLGEAAFATAAAEGRTLPLEHIIDYALAGDERPRSVGQVAARQDARSAGAREPLTPREREVARLIARGLSNRQIAGHLAISKLTADRHVSNILGKLGFASRVQVAAWVVERHHQAALQADAAPAPDAE